MGEIKTEKIAGKPKKMNTISLISILLSTIIIASAWIYRSGLKVSKSPVMSESASANGVLNKSAAVNLGRAVLPSEGVDLPVKWGSLGKQMVDVGVIDATQFESLYTARGGLSSYEKKILYGMDNGAVRINTDNSGVILNLLWALGLSNKNDILESGPIADPRYGGAGRFASTGGWSLAKGNAMDYYSKYQFIALTADQQKLVENVSKNVYRPCCDNPTYFPDCNHGIAMLGLLELMASHGVSEADMYKTALQVNSYWFPDIYLTIAKYFQTKGISWNKADAKKVLGKDFSSASGYQRVLKEITPAEKGGGGSCGVQ